VRVDRVQVIKFRVDGVTVDIVMSWIKNLIELILTL
jgi:hypothetical protein